MFPLLMNANQPILSSAIGIYVATDDYEIFLKQRFLLCQ